MGEKSKILIIGGTGYIGKFIVKASAELGHPTFALVRHETASNPHNSTLLESFKTLGVTLLYGDIYEHNSLVEAIKQVDVVISTVGTDQIQDQALIIAAIKECGNIKRFVPSEFETDVERVHPIEPAGQFFRDKVNVRRALVAEEIPYTLVISYGFAGYFLPNLGQFIPEPTPPIDNVVILGHGNHKEVIVDEEDIATYTIKAMEDPRTLNKRLKMRPPDNILSINELVTLWEKKTGLSLERIYVSEDQLLKDIHESSHPLDLIWAILHATFVKGDDSIFETNDSSCVEATELYPEVKWVTVDQYLDRMVRNL